MSKLFKTTIKVSENTNTPVIVTAQRTNNDVSGNPRYLVQVWVDRGENGNLWNPKIKGYRLNKNEQYTIQSYNIDLDIKHFIESFQQAVNV